MIIPAQDAWSRSLFQAGRFLKRTPVLEGLLIAVLTALGTTLISTFLSPLLFYNAGSAICWPSDGPIIAVLLLCERRRWPWILLGFLFNITRFDIAHDYTFGQSLVDCASNVFEVLFPAFFLPRCTSLTEWLRKPNLIVRLCIFALLLGPGIAAAFAQVYNSHHLGVPYGSIFLPWMASDSLGIALFTPLVLVLASRDTREIFRAGKRLQSALLVGLVLLSCWEIFHQTTLPLEFLLFPMLVVIVNMIGFGGAVITLNGITLIAAAATIHQTGPFMFLQGANVGYRTIMLQVYLIAAMIMSFAVALIRLDRRAFEEQLNLALHKMELLATHDSLTGLGNRRLFEKTLEAEWARGCREGRHLALLLLDADCFKSYNDLYGHLAGDDCLCEIAEAIKPVVRRAGDLAARYGGEEFVVLLPGSDLEDARRIAESIRDRVYLLELAHRGNPHGCVTVSIGCSSMIPSRGQRPTDLVKAADLALYGAKHQGRNRVEIRTIEPVPVS